MENKTGVRHYTSGARRYFHSLKAKLSRPGFYEPLTGAFASDCLLLALES